LVYDLEWFDPDHTSLMPGLIDLAVLYRRERMAAT
jgi:hypothetical protein